MGSDLNDTHQLCKSIPGRGDSPDKGPEAGRGGVSCKEQKSGPRMGVWSGWPQRGQGQLTEGGEEFGGCSGAEAACGALQAFLTFPSFRQRRSAWVRLRRLG